MVVITTDQLAVVQAMAWLILQYIFTVRKFSQLNLIIITTGIKSIFCPLVRSKKKNSASSMVTKSLRKSCLRLQCWNSLEKNSTRSINSNKHALE